MPSPKKPCPQCGGPMSHEAMLCRGCKPSYERTPEHRAKISSALRGRPRPAMRGRKRPGVGRKIAAAWTSDMREAAKIRGLAAAENRDWLVAIATSLSGGKNPRFRGKGKGSPYAPGWGREYRRKIRERAGGACEWCGSRPDVPLDLHHVDFTKTNHDPSNLVVICRSCHKKAHAKHKRSLME